MTAPTFPPPDPATRVGPPEGIPWNLVGLVAVMAFWVTVALLLAAVWR